LQSCKAVKLFRSEAALSTTSQPATSRLYVFGTTSRLEKKCKGVKLSSCKAVEASSRCSI